MIQPLLVLQGNLLLPALSFPYLAGQHAGPFRAAWKALAGCNFLIWESFVVGKKLYVGNLSYDVDNAALEGLFSTYGEVKIAEVIQDRDTGRSKGFGFVEMADDNAAQEAIRGLNETQHNGRPLTVNEARPKTERSGGGGGGYGGGRGGRGGGGGYRR